MVLAGCTVDPPSSAEPASPAPSSAQTAAPSTSAEASPAEPPPAGGAIDQPLVLVTHHSRPFDGLSVPRARRLIARAGPVLEPAAAASAVRAVADRPGLVAAVPLAALTPAVHAVAVGGVDPARAPEDYPIRTPGRAGGGPVVTVSVVGDIMLGRGVALAATGSADPAPALLPTSERLRAADLTVGNLESTLSRAGHATQGGDSFAADARVAASLAAAGFDVLGLANNHLGDFGGRALVQTVRRLRASGLRTFGAGATVEQAWAPAVVERRGVRFGFLGFNAIGETPSVRPGRAGAVSVGLPPRTGPLDEGELTRFEDAVGRLAAEVDVVVVLPHWGAQYTHRPEPVQRLVARRLVRAGADVVVGGHPHWLQPTETVAGRPVVHSLGNFVFDMDFMRQTREGAILELTFWGDRPKAARFVPYVMDDRFAPHVVTGPRARRVLSALH